MTVAAFLLECEVCHDKMGLLSGAVTSFICFSCAADKVFGTGRKDEDLEYVQAQLRAERAASSSPAATPLDATTPSTPAAPQDDLFKKVPTSDPLPTAYERFKAANDNAVAAYRRTEASVTRTIFGTWTPKSLQDALYAHSVPPELYERLVRYAGQYAPNAVYKDRRYGRLNLSKYYVWTDAELKEALR